MYKKRIAPSGAKARNTSIDLTAFSASSEQSAYWLGYVLANASIKNASVTIVSRVQDEDHLKKFRTFISNDNSINKVGQKGKPANRIVYRVVSQSFSTFLQQRGVVQERKDRVVHGKYADDKNFWRGYLDANSDIDEENVPPTFHVQGVRPVIYTFSAYITAQLGAKGSVLASKDVTRYEIVYSGKDAEKIVRHFWEGQNVFACEYMRGALDAFAEEATPL